MQYDFSLWVGFFDGRDTAAALGFLFFDGLCVGLEQR